MIFGGTKGDSLINLPLTVGGVKGKDMKAGRTDRGFEIINFKDFYGEECSLQQSSLAENVLPGHSAIWLGVKENRMHLRTRDVLKLIKHLQTWVDIGTFTP